MIRPYLWAAMAVFLLIVLTACEPADRRPGLWLTGEEVSGPVADWSFTEDHDEIFVETRTWYGVPHSVTTVLVTHDGTLYVPSLYRGEEPFPEQRRWNRNIVRDPRVRLKIGDRIFPRRAERVTDESERAAVLDAFAEKYPYWREMLSRPREERPRIVLIRMDPR